jgi:hypothetical protein
LEHRPTWGELYYILGLTPASLPDFLQALLLPHLLHLSVTDRQYALSFIQQHWSNGSWQLGSDAAFVAALAALAFVPAKVAPAAAAGSAAAARAAAATVSADGASSSAAAAVASAQQEQLYLARQLFDPTVPLFAKVMATMGVAALGAAAAAAGGAGGSLALFPAAPYDSAGWLQVRLACLRTEYALLDMLRLVVCIRTYSALSRCSGLRGSWQDNVCNQRVSAVQQATRAPTLLHRMQ